MKKITHVVGIDPGDKTGLALYSRKEQKITHFETTDFVGLIDFFRTIYIQGRTAEFKVFCEDTGLNPAVFMSGISYAKRLDTKKLRQQLRIARNVGMNQKECSMVITMLRHLGFLVIPVKPTTEKWDKTALKRITGITAPTNEHVRDAIKLCWKG